MGRLGQTMRLGGGEAGLGVGGELLARSSCLDVLWSVVLNFGCTAESPGALKIPMETSLVVQWLRLCAANAGDPGLIPGQGADSQVPHKGANVNK